MKSFSLLNIPSRQSQFNPMSQELVYFLHIFATILEPLGVFFLSVEAIKVCNLNRLRKFLVRPYRLLNPEIEWVDGDVVRPVRRTLIAKVGIGVAWIVGGIFFIPFYMLVATPVIIFLACTMSGLEKIEQNTHTGVIGLLGFVFWFVSFLINRIIT